MMKRFFTPSNLIVGAILLALSAVFLLPVVYAFVTSFKIEKDILSPDPSFFPRRLELSNYVYVFERGSKFLRYYLNSIVITVSGVAITVALSAMGGYAFAKLPFKGRDTIMGFVLFIISFPLAVLLIPIYIMEYETGLLNTNLGLILPNVTTVLPFSLFVMRGVFRSIPNEIEESTEIDGATVFQCWRHVMLPIALNGLSIVLIFSFYNIWGEYILAKTLATVDKAMPLSVGLTLLKGETWNFGILGAVISIALIPPVCVFIVFQKQLVAGIIKGALKE